MVEPTVMTRYVVVARTLGQICGASRKEIETLQQYGQSVRRKAMSKSLCHPAV